MTTRWCKKAPRIAFIVFIIVSLILGISILVALINGAFTKSDSENNNNINLLNTPPNSSLLGSSTLELSYVTTKTTTTTTTKVDNSAVTSDDINTDTHRLYSSNNDVRETPPTSSSSSLNNATNNRKLIFDDDLLERDQNGLNNVEYIKLKKVLVLPVHDVDGVYDPKNLDSSEPGTDNSKHQQHDVTGYFRHKTSRLWDPHPQYEIEAFGLKLHLKLYRDDTHIHEKFTVTHVWDNVTKRIEEDHTQLKSCFYKGQVENDSDSVVSVSLCGGMKGTIKSKDGIFQIEPVEEYTDQNANILHKIKRTALTSSNNNNENSAIIDNDKAMCELDSTLESDNQQNLQRLTDNRSNYNETHRGHIHRTTEDHNMDDDVIVNTDIHSRRKRSTYSLEKNIREYTIEVLVAVDKKMQEKHRENLKEYVLTLMSIVSSIYADESIGNIMHVAVVHIVHLNNDLAAHHGYADGKGVSASAMLLEFCRLKEKYKFPHDTAILLTREQICRSANQTKCDTLGLAELGTMCKSKSCAIVQDNGLSAAFTIAHELGHVLNMPHDDDKKCDEFRGKQLDKQNIMSRMLDHNTNPWSWSKCSRHFVTEYLEHNNALCLENKPNLDMMDTPERSLLAGEKFTNNQQCELAVGPKSKICSYMPVCTRLWCTQVDMPEHEGGCATQHMPWADGTECGEGMWCQKGECKAKDRRALRAIDGGWGPWSPYSRCTLTCGGGIQFSNRECDNPKPSNGGQFCRGSRIRYKSCNTEDCPADEPGIREKQCLAFNGIDQGLRLENPKWVPKYGIVGHSRDGREHREECKLYCQANNTVHYFELAPKVIDGTPCTQDGFDKCVMGVCEKAGCDNVLGSDKTLDRCGICGGNNDTCKDVYVAIRHDEMYKYKDDKNYYFYNITRIPKGATNIVITQPGCNGDLNYISLMGYNETYLLNSADTMSYYRKKIPYAGVSFEYNGGNSPVEVVQSTSLRKLQHPLIVKIAQLRPMSNNCENRTSNMITYSYSISTTEMDQRDQRERERDYRYSYNTAHYDRMPIQQQQHQQQQQQQQHNPPPQQQIPHYTWKMSDWSPCDQLCNGKKNRIANCYEINSSQMVPSHLAAKYCSRSVKPREEYETCNKECVLEWDTNKSECSETCGEGWRQVQVTCVQRFIRTDKYSKVDPSYCRQDTKPSPLEKCYGDCKDVTWGYGEWGPCSVTCGLGIQYRNVSCLEYAGGNIINDKHCKDLRQQQTMRHCNEGACPEWVYGEDGPCSVTCGEGKKVIRIDCRVNNVTVDSSKCGTYPRPVVMIEPCNMQPCENQIDTFEDHQVTTARPFTYNVIQSRNNHNTYHQPMSNEIEDVHYEWRTGTWGECSVACEGGQKARIVKCIKQSRSQGKLVYVDDSKCDPGSRPVSVVTCNNFRCPMWNMGLWSDCNDRCKKERMVICQDHRGKVVDDCPMHLKPHSEENCCHIKWRSTWKPCSNSCGNGVRTREIVCMKLFKKSDTNPYPRRTAKIIDSSYCTHMAKPTPKIMERECRSKRNCKFRWLYTHWGKCSAGCGSGYTKRSVYCSNGTVNASECNPKEKPMNSKKCESRSHCRWRTTKWRNCTCNGITKRRVLCMDALTNTQSNNCKEEDRPIHRDRCQPPPNCSCRLMQMKRGIREDGEQLLNIRGRQVSIYCSNMTSHHPKEYLTLRAGPQENYSIYYSKRARDITRCGDRYTEIDDPRMVGIFGTTRFERIRIDIHTLKVIDDDFTFATTYGRNQNYGTAGDCYGTKNACPQGDFSINLTGTKFRIRPKTTWEVTGQDSTMQYVIKNQTGYQTIRARCGGNCGSCAPSRHIGLYLEVVS